MTLPYKFFYDPFAYDGDRAAVPDGTQPDGSLSWQQGYGPEYALDPETDPDAILVGRDQFNETMYQVTLALAAIQVDFPGFVSDADNGGSPYPYNQSAVVRFSDGQLWQSLVAANTATPGTDPTKWVVFLSQYALQSALNAEIARAMAAEATKAPINSPTFTGNPRSPTFPPGTSGDLIATLNFVASAVAAETNRALTAEALLAPINSPFFIGIPQCVDPPPFGDSHYYMANMNQVTSAVDNERARAIAVENTKAPIDSPVFTGTPRTGTPPSDSSDTTIPNTAWVRALLPGPVGPGPTVGWIMRYAHINVPIGGSFALANFTWDSAFPGGCFAAVASAETNDTFNPNSAGNNFSANPISYGANGGTVRIDTEHGGSPHGSVPVSILGIGF